MDAPFHINNPDAEEGTEDIRSRHSMSDFAEVSGRGKAQRIPFAFL